MVKSTSEIVNSIPNCEGNIVERKPGLINFNAQEIYSCIRVVLNRKAVEVTSGKIAQQPIDLIDVLLAPLDLEPWGCEMVHDLERLPHLVSHVYIARNFGKGSATKVAAEGHRDGTCSKGGCLKTLGNGNEDSSSSLVAWRSCGPVRHERR